MDNEYIRLSLNGFESDERKLERVQRAMHEVSVAAAFLKREFSVNQVVLFGSLTEPGRFGAHSDIDLAVSGIQITDYYRANSMLMDIINGFDFDLVDMDACKPVILDNIKRTGVIL